MKKQTVSADEDFNVSVCSYSLEGTSFSEFFSENVLGVFSASHLRRCCLHLRLLFPLKNIKTIKKEKKKPAEKLRP